MTTILANPMHCDCPIPRRGLIESNVESQPFHNNAFELAPAVKANVIQTIQHTEQVGEPSNLRLLVDDAKTIQLAEIIEALHRREQGRLKVLNTIWL